MDILFKVFKFFASKALFVVRKGISSIEARAGSNSYTFDKYIIKFREKYYWNIIGSS